jgi:hypothetical protein
VPELPELTDLIGIVDARSSSALDRITGAEDVVAQLGRLGDRLIGYYIEKARAQGHSWSEIGAQLGISRQAAQQRYTPLWSSLTLADLAGAGAFTRFTARTKETLRAAERHARELRHDSIGIGHLLLGILDDAETLACRAIRATGADPDRVRIWIHTGLPAGSTPSPASIPIATPARRALEGALAEALELGHNYIGTEHILLGLLRDRTDPATGVLRDAGVTLEAARAAVRELIEDLLRNR